MQFDFSNLEHQRFFLFWTSDRLFRAKNEEYIFKGRARSTSSFTLSALLKKRSLLTATEAEDHVLEDYPRELYLIIM